MGKCLPDALESGVIVGRSVIVIEGVRRCGMEERIKRKILIVDDEESFCRFIKMYLEVLGTFEVSICCDSAKAIVQAEEQQPDLILLDVMMPGVSGPEVAEGLRYNVHTQEIPIVFLTSIATEEDMREKGNIIGGNYVVAKPLRASKLVEVINKVLISPT